MEQISKIDYNEVLRYLGYRDNPPDERTMTLIELASKTLLSQYKPRFLYGVYTTKGSDPIIVENTSLTLSGNDIKRHLNGCSRLVLTTVTISNEVDNLIRKTQIVDMATGVIMDCCATALIEQVCDEVELFIKQSLTKQSDVPLYFTTRFSPGYGDLPLDIQGEFLRTLNAPKRIGLFASEANILTPRKSVTAIIGVSTSPIIQQKKSCDSCNLQDSCKFKKEGNCCEF